jgi:hypothetical protein
MGWHSVSASGWSDYEEKDNVDEILEDMSDDKSTLQGDGSWEINGRDVELGLLGDGSSEHLHGTESNHQNIGKRRGSTTTSSTLDQSVPSDTIFKESNGEVIYIPSSRSW